MKKILILLIPLLLNSLISQDKPKKFWIVFKDKGPYENLKPEPEKLLSKRAIKRRLKITKDKTNIIDYRDLPVYSEYVKKIKSLGIKICVVSKWLNAVSAYLNEEQLEKVKKLNFVEEISPVAKAVETLLESPVRTGISLDYGPSEFQLEFMNIKKLHEMNIIGRGVLIGMMDTGFRKTHESLRGVNVIWEHDFIFNDDETANSPEDVEYQDLHGTITLSVLGGRKNGKIYGAAFGADFALAKTEDIRSETPAEEDYWVSAIEKMDSLGVDVVSSSLGYLDWYTYKDMDGKTAKITIAADIAFQKGIVVVNAAGNERNTPWKYIIAPADGKYVIAVGAVDSQGQIAPFSSMGPTYDGRIKPDVCGLGVGVFGASTLMGSSYGYFSGTSLSTPLVAGIAALVLSVHPELNSFQVREAIKNTASRANNPDNDYGWGIANGLEACLYYGPIVSNFPEIKKTSSGFEIYVYAMSKNGIKDVILVSEKDEIPMFEVEPDKFKASLKTLPSKLEVIAIDNSGDTAKADYFLVSKRKPPKFKIYQSYPNPFNSYTVLTVDLPENSNLKIEIYNSIGQKVRTLVDEFLLAGKYQFIWDGTDDTKQTLPSGVYFYRVIASGFSSTGKVILLK